KSRRLATSWYDGNVRFFDPVTGELLRMLPAHKGAVTNVVFSPDGQLLASVGSDRKVRVWNAGTLEQLAEFDRSGTDWAMTFSADSKRLAVSLSDKVRVFDVAGDRAVGEPTGGTTDITLPPGSKGSMTFTPDGGRFVAFEPRKPLTFWDV